jgi:hypothetical protein
MEHGAYAPGIDQQFRDGIDRNVTDAGNPAKGRTLDQHGEDRDASLQGELVPAPHDMNFLA